MLPQILVSQVLIPNQNSLDTLVIESLSSIGIDQIRSLRHFTRTAPLTSPQKLIIIQPADKLTLEAQNALLKLLEEPPVYLKIILVTLNPYMLLPTILSRCELIKSESHKALAKWDPSSQKPALLESLAIPTTLAQAITEAEKIKKDRQSLLLELFHSLVYYSHHLLQAPDYLTAKKAKLLVNTYHAVLHNSNLSLSLSHLFLHWPKSI